MRELDRLAGSYFDLLWHLDPAAASAAGSVSGDARLGRFDVEAMREHLAAFRATASAIEELDIEALADEIDRTALLDDLRTTVARLDEDRPHARDPGFWLSHLTDALAAMILRPGDPAAEADRARAVAERIAAIPAFLDSARAVLHRPPVLLVDGALLRLGPLGELLAHAASAFGSMAPGGAEAFDRLVRGALAALVQFGHRLRSEIEPEADAATLALGAARFDRRLNHRYALRSGSAELWRYAGALMGETEAALVEATRGFPPAADWRAALARLDEQGVDRVAGLRAEVARADAFLGGRGLLVGAATAPDVVPMPPALAPMMPPVSYLPGVGRVVAAAGAQSRLSLPVLAASVALPGRHMHELAARASGSEVRRRVRAATAVEGWALYAEEVMDTLGFFPEAETHAIRLARLLGAAARLAADVGLHTRGMTVADAIALLERAGAARGDAEAQVRHLLGHPTDGVAAAVGRREILSLRAAAGVSGGDPAALAAFHRTLLAYGALPTGLAGWGMGIER